MARIVGFVNHSHFLHIGIVTSFPGQGWDMRGQFLLEQVILFGLMAPFLVAATRTSKYLIQI